MSQTLLSLAGFQVILIGRFWVIAEAIGLMIVAIARCPFPWSTEMQLFEHDLLFGGGCGESSQPDMAARRWWAPFRANAKAQSSALHLAEIGMFLIPARVFDSFTLIRSLAKSIAAHLSANASRWDRTVMKNHARLARPGLKDVDILMVGTVRALSQSPGRRMGLG
jgi:hypothetical protein